MPPKADKKTEELSVTERAKRLWRGQNGEYSAQSWKLLRNAAIFGVSVAALKFLSHHLLLVTPEQLAQPAVQ